MAARPQETAIQLNETIQVVQRRHSMNGTMTVHTLCSFLLLETGQQSMGDLHLRLNTSCILTPKYKLWRYIDAGFPNMQKKTNYRP